MEKITSLIRVRMSESDAHYGGNLVDGARILSLFGDAATEVSIIFDGDEGLFLRYNEVQFLAPVYAGDYIEAYAELCEVGNTSRRMKFVAKKIVASRLDIGPSAADYLDEPITVCKAEAIGVVLKERKRK